MSRVDSCVHGGGQPILQQLIREQIGRLIEELLATDAGPPDALRHIVMVGNTVMHHLFCGVSLEPLSHHPFEPSDDGLQILCSADLGWKLPGNPAVRFLPGLGSFVSSDILAGLFATKLHATASLQALVDLGTNGEIVVGNCERMLCASTAAGPAFEGARVSMGMRAATGAIAEVSARDGQLQCRVLGGGPARGICGSGLVDAVAAGLELGWIESNGRFVQGHSLCVSAAGRAHARRHPRIATGQGRHRGRAAHSSAAMGC